MDQQAEPAFEANALIGTKFRTIDRAGVVTIADGRVTLRKKKGKLVAEAPVSEVWAETSRLGAALIYIDGRRLAMGAPFGATAASDDLAGGAANIARGVNLMKSGKDLAEQFLAVLEAEGGHIGKPPDQ